MYNQKIKFYEKMFSSKGKGFPISLTKDVKDKKNKDNFFLLLHDEGVVSVQLL